MDTTEAIRPAGETLPPWTRLLVGAVFMVPYHAGRRLGRQLHAWPRYTPTLDNFWIMCCAHEILEMVFHLCTVSDAVRAYLHLVVAALRFGVFDGYADAQYGYTSALPWLGENVPLNPRDPLHFYYRRDYLSVIFRALVETLGVLLVWRFHDALNTVGYWWLAIVSMALPRYWITADCWPCVGNGLLSPHAPRSEVQAHKDPEKTPSAAKEQSPDGVSEKRVETVTQILEFVPTTLIWPATDPETTAEDQKIPPSPPLPPKLACRQRTTTAPTRHDNHEANPDSATDN